jgi:hypothetical protein
MSEWETWQIAFMIMGGFFVVFCSGVAAWITNTPSCDEMDNEMVQRHIREYMQDIKARRAREAEEAHRSEG